VAGQQPIQQPAVRLRHTRMQQRRRGDHQHTSTLGVVGRVQEQAKEAVRHPAGLQDLAMGVDAELPHWLLLVLVVGGAPGYPAHAPPCWAALSRVKLPAAAASARERRTARRRPLRAAAHAPVRSGVGHGHDRRPLGWQPRRFLVDRAEAERAFALAERLGSVNAATTQLGTTWPSLRKAFTRHGLGMPARNPEAVRQRTIAAAHQRCGQPATPGLDPVFVALNPGALPARERSPAELYQWVRREEQYAIFGANVVVELDSESHARKPTTRAWAIMRRADRSHRLAGQRTNRANRRHADRTDRPDRADRTSRSHQPDELGMVADAR
jgi:hypothetical protein